MNQQVTTLQNRIVAQILCSANRLHEILRLQGNEIPFPGNHLGEPVNLAPAINSLYGRTRGGSFHARNCNTFTVTKSNFTRGHMGAHVPKQLFRKAGKTLPKALVLRDGKDCRASKQGARRRSQPLPKGSGAYGARTRNLCRDRITNNHECNTFAVTIIFFTEGAQ
jgi:hypothetical protein